MEKVMNDVDVSPKSAILNHNEGVVLRASPSNVLDGG